MSARTCLQLIATSLALLPATAAVQALAPGRGQLEANPPGAGPRAPVTAPALNEPPLEAPLRPAQEARPLGRPSHLPSAAPVDEAGAASGGLGGLDPRTNEIARVVGGLAVVIGLLVVVRLFIKRTGWGMASGGRPSGVVEILARFPVGRGHQLILLKLARRVVLLHHSGSTMTTLSEVSDPDEVAALLARVEAGTRRGGSEAGRFKAALKRFSAEHERLAGPFSLAGDRAAEAGGEVIDLTRGPPRRFGRPGGRRRLVP